MKWKHKSICTRTLEGLKQAEKLKASGWTIYSVSPNNIHFEKPIKSKNRSINQ